MLSFPEQAPIYLRTGATDMRKSINGLAGLVQADMGKNPFDSTYYVFVNKTRKLMKILYWDRTGFALWQKRLEEHKFPWPEKPGDAKTITSEQMHWLLAGIDFLHAHETLEYSIC